MATGLLAYEGEVPANVTVSVTGDIVAGEPIPISAAVLGPSGTGVPDIAVTFEITVAPPGADDALTTPASAMDTETPHAIFAIYRAGAREAPQPPDASHASVATVVTNDDGIATVNLILDAVVGSRTIEADAEGEALGAVTITLQPSGLPNTAGVPASSEAPPILPSVIAVLIAATLVFVFGSRRLRLRSAQP